MLDTSTSVRTFPCFLHSGDYDDFYCNRLRRSYLSLLLCHNLRLLFSLGVDRIFSPAASSGGDGLFTPLHLFFFFFQ